MRPDEISIIIALMGMFLIGADFDVTEHVLKSAHRSFVFPPTHRGAGCAASQGVMPSVCAKSPIGISPPGLPILKIRTCTVSCALFFLGAAGTIPWLTMHDMWCKQHLSQKVWR